MTVTELTPAGHDRCAERWRAYLTFDETALPDEICDPRAAAFRSCGDFS
jgi:hypothetical protein